VHEAALSEAIVGAVVARAAGRPIRRIRLRIGAAHRVSLEALDEAVHEASAGTPAEGAALEVETVPVSLLCQVCGAASDVEDPWAACPACGAVDVETRGGQELLVESIEVDGG
jgi:hydrogenase nickel incorporation protein HypA/HybF